MCRVLPVACFAIVSLRNDTFTEFLTTLFNLSEMVGWRRGCWRFSNRLSSTPPSTHQKAFRTRRGESWKHRRSQAISRKSQGWPRHSTPTRSQCTFMCDVTDGSRVVNQLVRIHIFLFKIDFLANKKHAFEVVLSRVTVTRWLEDGGEMLSYLQSMKWPYMTTSLYLTKQV